MLCNAWVAELDIRAGLKIPWPQGRVGSTPTLGTMAFYRTPILNSDKSLQAYVIGLAIGDGNLSNPNGRAVRLRITCDKKYPILLRKIAISLKKYCPKIKSV